jgi:hypothetical protein
MLDKLKADFDGILELVQKCPPTLQETALKTILENWFTSAVPGREPIRKDGKDAQGGSGDTSNLPDAMKSFMTANGITGEVLSKAFHPTGPGAQLLLSEIGGTGKSQKQANLALLLAVRQALNAGAFTCTLKELREMAVHYDCYDSANFSTNLKTHKNYFKPRTKGSDLELSGPGLKRAGELIKGNAQS